MHLFFLSALLGAAASVVRDTTTEKTDSLMPHVTTWPPGSNLHQGETVLLLCSLHSNSSSSGTYRWFRADLLGDLTSGPQLSVHGDRLSIQAVSRRDQGRYWCQTEQREGNKTQQINSQTVELRVRDSPGPTLTMTPDSRHFFNGEKFTLVCPKSTADPSHWRLRHFSQDSGVTGWNLNSDSHALPQGGAVSLDVTDGYLISAVNGSRGLYWCESAEDRTNAVNITVSLSSVIIRTPVSPVPQGLRVSLYCQYRTVSPSHTSFYKNGKLIKMTSITHSNKTVIMTIDKVTQKDEGFYKCKSEDQRMESEESWLSVHTDQGRVTTADGEADVSNGQGWWIILFCSAPLFFLIPVCVGLLWRNRYKAKRSCNCWKCCKALPHDPQDVPAADLPVTKQDVTEVQWDLSWMEMTNLLDKNLCPGT